RLGLELVLEAHLAAPVEADERRQLGRAVHERRHREGRAWLPAGGLLGDLLGAPGWLPGGVAAAHTREQDVLLAPHHALGHAGRAAGVDDVEVAGRAGCELPVRRSL